jgi:hypothetical protein
VQIYLYSLFSSRFFLSSTGVFFVTRQKTHAVYTCLKEFDITDDIDPSILRDERITVEKKDGTKVELRRVAYWHGEQRVDCFSNPAFFQN